MLPSKKNWIYYIAILRPNQWFKNLVVIFGSIAAVIFFQVSSPILILASRVFLAFVLACFVSSANYIVNGITDEITDAHHPIKKNRAIPSRKIAKKFLYLAIGCLFLSSILIAITIYGLGMFISLLFLFMAGIVYNIKPLRFKDLPFIDVISESVNNPIRILIGWFAVSEFLIFPPFSFLLLFWVSGAVFMSAKRYAELNFLLEFHPETDAALYRNSYRFYTPPKIFLMVLFYSIMTAGLFIFFSIRYQTRLLASLPIIFGFFIWFLIIMKEKKSFLREPESAFSKKPLFFLTTLIILLILMFLALSD